MSQRSAVSPDLDWRYSGLGDALRAGVSVVIDGLLIARLEYEPLANGAQVYFVPRLPEVRRRLREVRNSQSSNHEILRPLITKPIPLGLRILN